MNPHDHRPGDPQSLHPPGVEERVAPSSSTVPLIELVNVSSAYGSTTALENLSLKIWPGVAEEQVAGKAHLIRAGVFSS